MEKISRCENSDVLPAGSVAVAVMRDAVLDLRRQDHVDRGVARSVRRDLRGTQIVLAFEVFLRPGGAGGIGKEVDVEGRRRRAVQHADDVRSRSLSERRTGRGQDGIVLQAVRPRVAVAVVVGVTPNGREVDPERLVVEDPISPDPRHLVAAVDDPP